MSACIGEPVSWLRLERYGLGEVSAADAREIAEHLAACPLCGECFERIAGEGARAPAPAPERSRGRAGRPSRALAWAAAGTLLSAAFAAWLMVWPQATTPRPAPETSTKGGSLALELVRVDARGRLLEPNTFASGDRFKLLFSCPPAMTGELRVWAFQGGEVFEPLPALEHAACGNRRDVPGALQLTGAEPIDVCAVMLPNVKPASAPAALALPASPSQLPQPHVCVRVTPE